LLLTNTATAADPSVTPLIPAIKVLVAPVPIRMVFDSAATPVLPMSMLPDPMVRLNPASLPTAMLSSPLLLVRAPPPKAVLALLVVLLTRALAPTAVLSVPVS
jgi:hypothetical protein